MFLLIKYNYIHHSTKLHKPFEVLNRDQLSPYNCHSQPLKKGSIEEVDDMMPCINWKVYQ